MASNYDAARQEYTDRIAAGVVTGIPFIQHHENYGKDAVAKSTRSHGIINLFVPAGGTGGTADLANPDGSINHSALDLSSQVEKAKASYYEVRCTSMYSWELYDYDSLEELFQIGDIDKNIIEGRITHLSQNSELKIMQKNWTRANGACVASDTELGFVAMNKAMSMLKTIKAAGNWTGYISPLFASKLSTSAAKKNGGFDVPDDVLKGMYGRNAIGIYNNADWVEEAFLPEFSCGALNTTDSASGITVKEDVDEQGATSIKITGFTASGTIKKGTPFTIEGVYDVTMVGGIPVPFLKTFIVQEDANATADSDKYKYTLKVLPIYFNDDTKGYQNNVYASASKISQDAVVKGLCEISSSYYVGFIKEHKALNLTPYKLPDVANCKNTTTATDDILIQLVSDGDALKRLNMMRFDFAYFCDIVDPRACRLVYYKK